MENEDLKKLLEARVEINLKSLNDALKESQERVKQFTAAFGQLRQETQLFTDVIPKLNKNKNLIELISTYDKENIDKSLTELEKYQLKRQAIVEKKDKVITNEKSTDNDKKLAYLTMEEELQALDIATLKKTEIWTNLFASVDKLSKKSIKSQINDIESLLKYIKTNKAEGSIPTGFSEKEIARINEIAKGYTAGTDAAKAFVKETEATSAGLKKSLKELNTKNPVNKIIEGFKGLGGAAADSKQELESVNTILEGFNGLGSAFTQLGKAMDEAGIKAGKVVVTIGNVISQTASMAGAGASVGGPWGAIIGAVVGLGSSLIPALQTTSELSESTKNYYESLIKLTDELIQKQIELIKISTGSAVTVASNTAEKWLKYQDQLQKQYMKEYLDKSGSDRSERHDVTQKLKEFYIGKSNIEDVRENIRQEVIDRGGNAELFSEYPSLPTKPKNEHQNDLGKLFTDGIIQLQPTEFFNVEELEAAGIDVIGILTDVTGTLGKLDAKQIEVLKEHAPELWGQFDEKTQNYLNATIEREKKLEEIKNAARESNTGTTFEKLQTSLFDLVKQTDVTFDKISKSFEGHMSDAILNMVKKKYLTDKLETWYGNFSDKMGKEELTPKEIEELKTEYKKIVEDANDAYKTAMDVAGLKIPEAEKPKDESQTRSATAQGIASMSQDSASELNGNFYRLFMTVDGIHQIIKKREEQEVTKEYTLPTLQEMLDVNKSSNTYLLDIRNNTSHLIAIDENILNMNHNILALRNEGIKMRS